GVVVLLDFFLVFVLVGRDVSSLLPVGPPGELFDTVRRVGALAGFPAAHGKYENLWPGLSAGSINGDKRQSIAARRPARCTHTYAFIGQRVLRSRGDMYEYELAVAAVLLDIWARDHEHYGFAVRGDLRIGN